MSESRGASLLVEYYESFLQDRDIEQFRDRVLGRYSEGTLARVLNSSAGLQSRRAAVLALGVLGSFAGANDALGRSLRDEDPIVRTMAESALWALWFRADSPANNQLLEEIRRLIADEKLDEAVEAASRLIARAPRFAEAYNQRAIARFIQGNYAESAQDCHQALRLNPYHVGAAGGLVQCHLELNQPREALGALRRASKMQPHSEPIRRHIQMLELRIETEGPLQP